MFCIQIFFPAYQRWSCQANPGNSQWMCLLCLTEPGSDANELQLESQGFPLSGTLSPDPAQLLFPSNLDLTQPQLCFLPNIEAQRRRLLSKLHLSLHKLLPTYVFACSSEVHFTRSNCQILIQFSMYLKAKHIVK